MWNIIISDTARKALDKIDKKNANKILDRIEERILNQSDPSIYAKPLKQNMSGLWRLRVENYRIIFRIINDEHMIHVLRIGHRKDIYD